MRSQTLRRAAHDDAYSTPITLPKDIRARGARHAAYAEREEHVSVERHLEIRRECQQMGTDARKRGREPCCFGREGREGAPG